MIITNGCYCVYAHINKINNKIYIGITSRNPVLRWNYNGSGYIHCSKFWNAIKKYGWDQFEHVIIAKNLTQSEAVNMERVMIEKLNCIKNGYNIDQGGFACKHNKETIEKIRQANVGKVVTEETKRKIREARSKQIMSPEAIEKAAQKNRGKKRSEEFKQNLKENKKQFMKKVFVVETKQVFDSICEAARVLNCHKSTISYVCHHNGKLSNGLHLQFVNA